MSASPKPAPTGFTERTFEDSAGRRLRVFSKGAGPSVIVLHELPGLTRECLALADRLSEMFTVFLPLLFGEPGDSGALLRRVLSLQQGFCLFTSDCSSPILTWLRAFCRHVQASSPRQRIGLVGNCLTGSLVISLLADPGIAAPVMSQPALPLPIPGTTAQKRSLGVSPEDLRLAKARVEAEDIQILGFRFSKDWISPRDRFETLKAVFPAHFEAYEIQSPDPRYRISSRAHAVLTEEYRALPEDHPTHRAYERLVAFLWWRLGGRP